MENPTHQRHISGSGSFSVQEYEIKTVVPLWDILAQLMDNLSLSIGLVTVTITSDMWRETLLTTANTKYLCRYLVIKYMCV